MRRWTGPALAGFGVALVAGGLWLGRWFVPTAEWRDLRFGWEETASAPGAVTGVDETGWSRPATREGLLPLPVYRVRYRYGLDDGRNFEGASYTTGLFHRLRDPVTVVHLRSDPGVSRAHRTTLAPRGPVGLLSLGLPALGALLVAAGLLATVVARRASPRVP